MLPWDQDAGKGAPTATAAGKALQYAVAAPTRGNSKQFRRRGAVLQHLLLLLQLLLLLGGSEVPHKKIGSGGVAPGATVASCHWRGGRRPRTPVSNSSAQTPPDGALGLAASPRAPTPRGDGLFQEQLLHVLHVQRACSRGATLHVPIQPLAAPPLVNLMEGRRRESVKPREQMETTQSELCHQSGEANSW